MAVDLLSDDNAALRVDSLDPLHREQPIVKVLNGQDSAYWQWRLTANQLGLWKLRLRAFVRRQGENVLVKEVPALTRVQAVNVDPAPLYQLGSFISSYWQWLLTTLLIPLGVAIFSLWRLRRGEEKKPPPRGGPPSQGRKARAASGRKARA